MATLLLMLIFTIVSFAEDNIAVFPFENKLQDDCNLTELAENEMTSLLVNQKRFEVIERKDIDKILKEQHFSNSGIVNINQALQIGKIKGIKYGVFGQITNVSYTNKELALITLQIKIIDMETANVMFSKVYNSKPKNETSNGKNTVLTNMLKQTFKKQISNDLINTFTIEGSIVDITGKRVIIDVGKKQGVVRGMEFNVIDSQEKISKRTNKKVTINKAKALLEVQEVLGDDTALCKFKEGEKLEEGMTVKLVQVDDRYYKAEDIEKLLTRRGIQKGDLLVSIYGGYTKGTISLFSFQPIDSDNSELNLSGNSYGLQFLLFINSYLGFGIDLSISRYVLTGNNIFSKTSIFINNDNFENYGKETYTNYYKHENYEGLDIEKKDILVRGRINLNNSSFRAYIPLGFGISIIKQKSNVIGYSQTDIFQKDNDGMYERGGYHYKLDKQFENWQYSEEKKEIAFCGYLGIGLELNLTNNISLGIEGRYNITTAKEQINVSVGLLKLGYKFNELIKF